MKIISASCHLEKGKGSIIAKIICDRLTMEMLEYTNMLIGSDRRPIIMVDTDFYRNYQPSELTFVLPGFLANPTGPESCDECYKSWRSVMKKVEKEYFKIEALGCTEREMKCFLVMGAACEVTISGSYQKWAMYLSRLLSNMTPYNMCTNVDQIMTDFCWAVENKPCFEPLREVCLLWRERIGS